MASGPLGHQDEVREALRAIVADPQHGPDSLSDARVLSALLADYLPDAPRETSVLVAAAGARLATTLRDHVSGGMDPRVASALTASNFASRTAYAPEVCDWAVKELARALGLPVPEPVPDAQPGPAGPRAGGPGPANPARPREPFGGSWAQGRPGPAGPAGAAAAPPSAAARPPAAAQPPAAAPPFAGAQPSARAQPSAGAGVPPAAAAPPRSPGAPRSAGAVPPAGDDISRLMRPVPATMRDSPGVPTAPRPSPAAGAAATEGSGGSRGPLAWDPARGAGAAGGAQVPGAHRSRVPRQRRTWLLAGGGAAVVVAVAVAAVVLLNGGGPPPAPVRPLSTILAPLTNSCHSTGGLGMSGVTAASRCLGDNDGSAIKVSAYQFDSNGDYQSGLQSLNTGLAWKPPPQSGHCPPTGASKSGEHVWHSIKYAQRPGQYIECFTGTGGPTYLLTIPTQRAAFIAEGPSLEVLQSWITNENFG